MLHTAEMSPDLGPEWRFRGSTPTPERWAQTALSQTLAQFLVVSTREGIALGLVLVHQPNHQDGHAHISLTRIGSSSATRIPSMILGFALFIRYVFFCWDFRKLYMEVAEYNYGQFSSGLGRLFEMEGRLKEHYFAGGRFWDQVILAMYRERWAEEGARLLALEDGP